MLISRKWIKKSLKTPNMSTKALIIDLSVTETDLVLSMVNYSAKILVALSGLWSNSGFGNWYWN